MPHYTFRNKKTGKTFTKEMKMAEREGYLKENPNLEQVLTKIFVGDAVRQGITKPPADFTKYVLGKVKEKVPNSNIGERRYDVAKEI